ncbi:MAG: decaprenyl-phosphate phosphoribosyltransferase [Candidatus Edwardsbacteria bacterium]|nr:decaprenyl-phosphate phosphoribosyltransferase [Candidatus Edwardsbacteria bacterium]MBU1575677.1 decaprenyl-phosphate phosphoribosyltransferase [Candidatus Edwardsbacteria bacterium]MBU2463768.1 decaprenyl-phosphate phosphoribosyltransferase [Candidatus Edwardsbacteria bacterium]MBU2594069.1 decaprenyl-phosphate phosphoribosyltransferase [Candidatus Edwardsbacteria bacterium]
MIKNIFISMRPRQWTKNLIIFAGLIFSQNLGHPLLLAKTIIAVVLFCAISGAVYIINDILDYKSDQLHPVKKQRPIASGALPRSAALAAAVILGFAGCAIAFLINLPFGMVALSYLLLMLGYSLWLKRLVIIDVFVIAAGFVMRAAAGAEAVSVPISDWLLICVILLSLFLALAKRRQEMKTMENEAVVHRQTLSDYSDKLLDQMIAVVTAAVVVSYSLYTMWPETVEKFGTSNLKFTIPIVLYGIFRYLYLIYRKNQGEQPETVLLTDRWLLSSLVVYVLAVWLIIYQ